MKTRIFIFLSLLALLAGCLDRSIPSNDFIIRVFTDFKKRTGKDSVQCWVNDTLVFDSLYVNMSDDQNLIYYDDWLGMEVASFDKKGYDSIKIRIRVTSLDTVLYCGRRTIDSTFRYRIDNIPSIVISCDPNVGILLWDTLRTPDYFWLEW
ncbi:hypothetical protein [Bacteroides togonis]|uniref:hypothetical protein n=1 Tax=Bacteroides togonis TaxID=1917883 RepID=UPI00094B151B|nr:hypothetical protein [Bacteroides togonis]